MKLLSKICCFSTDICKCSLLNLSRNQNIKLTYILIVSAFLIISWLKNSNVSKQQITEYDCSDIGIDNQQCVRLRKTLIESLSSSVLFLLIFILMVPKTKHIKVINEGLWIIKLIILVGLAIIITLTFGPSISSVLEDVFIWVSIVLYIIINLVFIDLVYFVDFRINYWGERSSKAPVLKIIISIICFLSAVALNFFSYYQNQLWISIANSIGLAIFLAFTFLRISKNNSLFVYAAIMLHFNLISYSINQDDTKFNEINLEKLHRILICYITLFSMLCEGGNQIRTKNSTINENLALNTTKKQQDNRYVSSNKWLIYHFVMSIIVLGLPIIMIYEIKSVQEDDKNSIYIGRLIWWLSGILIYLWTIIVNKIYPQQDLGQLQNYFKQFELN